MTIADSMAAGRAKTPGGVKNALKEAVQEIALCGLARAGFFRKAAFYGGTALRLFYGLDRFSEDLGFSLVESDPEFRFSDYFPILKRELSAAGLNFTIEEREKTADSHIKSAFLKGNTKEHVLNVFKDTATHPGEVTKIKLEVDVAPPPFAGFEMKYGLLPAPYEVRLYDLPSLFAGKLHAVLCRSWKSRVKGRDLYDYAFYLSKGAVPNLGHLKARLVQSGFVAEDYDLNEANLKNLLCERFKTIDYAQAKEDVFPFIEDKSKLELWSAEFFTEITLQFL